MRKDTELELEGIQPLAAWAVAALEKDEEVMASVALEENASTLFVILRRAVGSTAEEQIETESAPGAASEGTGQDIRY